MSNRTEEEAQKCAESLARAAGIVLNLQKDRFVISKDTLQKLILNVAENEYIRGWNNSVCVGCVAWQRAGAKTRPHKDPSKVYPFCTGCSKRRQLRRKENGES